MEEKVLVKGKFARTGLIGIIFCAIAVLTLIICFIVAAKVSGNPMWAFVGIRYGYYWFFIFFFIFLFIGILFLLFQYEITVTDKAIVISKSILSFNLNEITLPIKSITAVRKGLFKTIGFANNSTRVNIILVSNNNEIYDTVQGLIK